MIFTNKIIEVINEMLKLVIFNGTIDKNRIYVG